MGSICKINLRGDVSTSSAPSHDFLIGVGIWAWIDPVSKRARIFLATLIAFAAVVLAISKTALIPVRIDGESMEPTLRDGSMHILNAFAYRSRLPERGDLVAVVVDGELSVKRVIGIPGDTIGTEDAGTPVIPPIRLQTNEFFVIGDNRQESSWVKALASEIVGKMAF